MMFWDPSWLRVERTTEGDEYAFEVTHVQCSTKMTSSVSMFPITSTRGPIPKTPSRAGVDDRLVMDADALAAAFLEGGVGGTSVVEVPAEGVEKRARVISSVSVDSTSGV
jgi:hypothetical protein